MASSQNGWPVATRDQQDRAPLIRDVTVPNGVLAGDVAIVFRWLAAEYDRRVERLQKGECWGWFVKSIEGSSTISNHASGTAVDFNAPGNPMGQGTTKRSMTAAQIDTCHALERESGGVLRWGGDFSRNDPMHWEINADRAAVAAFARKIKGRDMLNDEDKKWLTAEITRVVRAEVAGVDEAVRSTARNSKEFLSDTEKNEIVKAVTDGVKALLNASTLPTTPATPAQPAK